MRKAVAILLMALFVVTIFTALSCAPKEETAEEEPPAEQVAPAGEETAPAMEQPAEEAPAETEAPEGE